MKDYLDQRGDNYVTQRFPSGAFNQYNPVENYSALLRRMSRIGEDIEGTIEFLSENEDSVIDTIELAVSTLEVKLQVMRDAIQNSAKIKMDLSGAPSDVSMIDLSKGRFENMSYSVSDHGIILNSKTVKYAVEI